MEKNKIIFYDKFISLRESDNYPPGTDNDPGAPWNQNDPEYKSIGRGNRPASIDFQILGTDGEFALFQDRKNNDNLYISYIDDSESIGLEEYRKYTKEYIGKDRNGDVEYEKNYMDSFEEDDIEDWAYDNITSKDIGVGLEDWESSNYLAVKLDEELAQELYDDFSKYSSKRWRNGLKHFKEMPKSDILLQYNDMKDSIKNVFPSVESEWEN